MPPLHKTIPPSKKGKMGIKSEKETHPKIGAENMRVASSHQKNALNTFAK